MLRLHEKRLRTMFQRALLAAVAAPAAVAACNYDALIRATATDDGGGTPDASVDGTAAVDSAVDPDYDAGPCGPIMYDAGPDGADLCARYTLIPCGIPPGVATRDNCFFNLDDCAGLCGQIAFNCHSYGDSCSLDGAVVPLESGAIIVDCVACPGGAGRRPRGLARPELRRGASAVGDYFARSAHLEGASVHAFHQLEGSLRSHGAPARLANLTKRAARDEVRHARVTSRLAKRFGGIPAPVRVRRDARKKSLAAVALENLVEGCIRETYGALVVTWQAAHATDPEVASAMTRIAADETRHAALSWAIDGWARELLSSKTRARLAARAAVAIAELESAIVEPAGDLVRVAGLPNAARQRVLLRELAAQISPGISA